MQQRPSPRLDANETIEHYRRRRGRAMPAIFAALAVILLVGGIALVVMWLSGNNPPAFLATDTPTPTATFTPIPPSATRAVTDTPVPTETPTPTATRPVSYTVELGDTITSIAERFGLSVEVLIAANPDVDPNAISVGQVLTIPPVGAEPPSATPLPTGLPKGTKIPYVVRTGDTLLTIASHFNSTVEAIMKENNILEADKNKIQVGTTLMIPVNLVTPTATFAATPTRTATATGTSVP